ncbi:alpha/beta hydrolase [Tenacibaculum amylolyticum]|uniref:alpha/beta hydrolase n=1 Tax=Tenacibaculum amylolyticum TaxID=104269 RepID=UPI00389377C8
MKKVLYILFLFFIAGQLSAQQKNQQALKAKKLSKAVLFDGTLERIELFPSKYIKERPVGIWLPKGYSKDKKYAVLYMHDGQNLFDATTTWNKQEWKIDEWASKLMQQKKIRNVIVVGIHSISDLRWRDLFPEKAIDYFPKKALDTMNVNSELDNLSKGLKGDEYLKFLTKELKPFIDENYATLSDQQNTFVGGSSMGGLMSMYAITQYPEVFYGAACLSTHWPGINPMKKNPFAEAIFNYLEANIPSSKNHKFYFDYGTETLDQYYLQYAIKVDRIFKSKGYTDKNFENIKFEGADHSENSWNKRLDIPLLFLLQN